MTSRGRHGLGKPAMMQQGRLVGATRAYLIEARDLHNYPAINAMGPITHGCCSAAKSRLLVCLSPRHLRSDPAKSQPSLHLHSSIYYR